MTFYCAQCGGPPRTVEHFPAVTNKKRFWIECANCTAVSHNFSDLDLAWRDWIEMQKQLPDKK